MKKSWQGIFYVLFAALLWSTAGLFIKNIPADPLIIAGLRAFFAGLSLAPFVSWRKMRITRTALVYFFSYALLTTTFVTATKFTTAANAIALQYTCPLYIFLYTVLVDKEKVKKRAWLPMLLIVLGISIFLAEPGQGKSLLGNFLGLLSGVAFAVMTLSLRSLRDQQGTGLISLGNFVNVLLLLPFLTLHQQEIFSLPAISWLSLLYLGTLQLGLGYVFYVKGVQTIPAVRASVLALTEAFLNPIWVLIFLGEKPTVYGLVGGVLVIAAVGADLLLNKGNED
jgi:drug/metabolite transporter (DMT)-like permease